MAIRLKPQDLVLALKLVALGPAEWTQVARQRPRARCHVRERRMGGAHGTRAQLPLEAGGRTFVWVTIPRFAPMLCVALATGGCLGTSEVAPEPPLTEKAATAVAPAPRGATAESLDASPPADDTATQADSGVLVEPDAADASPDAGDSGVSETPAVDGASPEAAPVRTCLPAIFGQYTSPGVNCLVANTYMPSVGQAQVNPCLTFQALCIAPGFALTWVFAPGDAPAYFTLPPKCSTDHPDPIPYLTAAGQQCTFEDGSLVQLGY